MWKLLLVAAAAACLWPAGVDARSAGVARTCSVPAGPLSYRWPVRPFDRVHPVRGNFGDPRTLLRGEASSYSFHNGIDIVAEPWTPVYPVVSGVVVRATWGRIVVASSYGRHFHYWHLYGVVRLGDRVLRGRTVLGFIRPTRNHLHFAEIRNGIVQNPLAPGHLGPYSDSLAPRVTTIDLTDTAAGLEIVAEAYDPPAQPLSGAWSRMEMTPAALSWSLSAEDGRPVVGERVAIDFRSSEPSPDVFWSVYARGTLQNFATVGRRYRFGKPGRYRFLLTPQPLDTRDLPPGHYVVRVAALDVCGNVGSLTRELEVAPRPEPAELVAAPPRPVQPKPITAPPSRVPARWPHTQAGYTVVLASIPRIGGAKAAQALAGSAREAGLGDVGVLLSDRYPSLRPGYWVVFTGIYETSGQAQEAAITAGLRYQGAAPRPVVPRVPVRSWRPGRRGYTIVLASVPERAGLAAAMAEARNAAGAGLRGVGVLRSSRFPGLQPGYFVVFAGGYASGELAQRALTRVARLYPGAYPRAIG